LVLIYRKTDFSVSLRIDINLNSWLKHSVRKDNKKCKGDLWKKYGRATESVRE
jgi:hypothetical protein